MKSKLIKRNKKFITNMLKVAKKDGLPLEFQLRKNLIENQIHMRNRLWKLMKRRNVNPLAEDLEPKLTCAVPWFASNFIIPCVNAKGAICNHIIVTAERLKEMRNA
ncbi:hypothetical protein ICL29_004111 [Salmonella enterica]|nr:hypothetical protein [Salmonella enterica]EHK5999387.1 hypothetical protein [Salmonella enterica]EIF5124606.1 hypothetical protein [Salmonella enterica]EIF5348782.1 hypothetical protein [Salmonella enterica]EIF5657379.1 hypothetical protein [Salmonella enterica]